MAGNPNPSPETRFKAGEPNPNGGKTSAQRKFEYEASEMAARVRHRTLSLIVEKMEADATANPIEGMTAADVIRLLKDADDRAHGTPKAAIDHTSSDGSMRPVDHNAAVIAALQAKHAPKPD